MRQGHTPPRSCASRAFTLVEVLIVVVILGILAAVVTPVFGNASESARQTAFVSNLRVFADGIEVYHARTGSWPPDGSSGVLEPSLRPYLREQEFEGGTPIGGVWDNETNDTGGYAQAVGVHFNGSGETRNDAYMAQVDAIIDDGDVEAGRFGRIASGRYYLVIAD